MFSLMGSVSVACDFMRWAFNFLTICNAEWFNKADSSEKYSSSWVCKSLIYWRCSSCCKYFHFWHWNCLYYWKIV